MIKIVRNIKWLRLKRKLFKLARRSGCDLDGDIVTYKRTKYWVDVLTKEARPLSTPVPGSSQKIHTSK